MNPAPALALLFMMPLLTGCGGDATSSSPISADAAVVPALAISGHMERDLSDDFIGPVLEKYSFTAHTLGNGVVQGRFEVKDFGPGLKESWAKGRVTCLSMYTDGVTARIGGIVESAGDPQFIGSEAAWWVRDTGEGLNQDLGTDLRWGLPPGSAEVQCTEGIPLGTFGFTSRGNVQIRQ
jgi:hypothetical protein